MDSLDELKAVRRLCRAVLQCLLIFRWNVLSDVLNPAVEDAAQIVDGGRSDRTVIAKLLNRCTGNMMCVYQSIGGLICSF